MHYERGAARSTVSRAASASRRASSRMGGRGPSSSPVAAVAAGLCVFWAAMAFLYWNEGEAVARTAALDAATREAVTFADADAIDPARHAGALVHFAAKTKGAPLADADFGVSHPDALRLTRRSETYQWFEHKRETRTEEGEDVRVETTITYDTRWSPKRVNSDRFEHPAGHRNPRDDEYRYVSPPGGDSDGLIGTPIAAAAFFGDVSFDAGTVSLTNGLAFGAELAGRVEGERRVRLVDAGGGSGADRRTSSSEEHSRKNLAAVREDGEFVVEIAVDAASDLPRGYRVADGVAYASFPGRTVRSAESVPNESDEAETRREPEANADAPSLLPLASSPASPAVGDRRVTHAVLPGGETHTILARVTPEGVLEPWIPPRSGSGSGFLRRGRSVWDVRRGVAPLEDVLASLETSNAARRWGFRLAGFAGAALGTSLVAQPIGALAEALRFVPLVGDLAATFAHLGVAFASVSVAFCSALGVVAASWVSHRPHVAAAALAGAVGAAWIVRKRSREARDGDAAREEREATGSDPGRPGGGDDPSEGPAPDYSR